MTDLSLFDMLYRIDAVADTQRHSLVGDPVRAFEYKQAYDDAVTYNAAGLQGPIPQTIQVLMALTGWDLQNATTNILEEGQELITGMQYLRELRLVGKAAVAQQYASDPDAAAVLMQHYIEQLKLIVPSADTSTTTLVAS